MVTTVILAGGNSQRFETLGSLLPKPLLPVSKTQTVLSRLLDQLTDAGLRKIIISTSRHNFPMLQPFVERYHNVRHVEPSAAIRLLLNDHHSEGPVAALRAVITTVPDDLYLLCLADIVFLSNPFRHSLLSGCASGHNYILSSSDPDWRGSSGLVFSDMHQKVNVVSYSQLSHNVPRGQKISWWSGSLLFGRDVVRALQEYQCTSSDIVLEDFIARCLDDGIGFSVLPTPKFVNINTFNDLQRLICAGTVPGSQLAG